MPPKANHSNSANGTENLQKNKDALFLFECLFSATSPIVVNVGEVANKRSQQVQTITKRIKEICNRHPGLDFQTTTVTDSTPSGNVGTTSASDNGIIQATTPVRKAATTTKKAGIKSSTPTSTAAASAAKGKAAKVKKSEVMVNDNDDSDSDLDHESDSDEEDQPQQQEAVEAKDTNDDGDNATMMSNDSTAGDVRADSTLSNFNDSVMTNDAPASKKANPKAKPSESKSQPKPKAKPKPKPKTKATPKPVVAKAAGTKRKRDDDDEDEDEDEDNGDTEDVAPTSRTKKAKLTKNGGGNKSIVAATPAAKKKTAAKATTTAAVKNNGGTKTANNSTTTATKKKMNDQSNDVESDAEIKSQTNNDAKHDDVNPRSVSTAAAEEDVTGKEKEKGQGAGDKSNDNGNGNVKTDLALDIVKQYADKSRKTPISKATTTSTTTGGGTATGTGGSDDIGRNTTDVPEDNGKQNNSSNDDNDEEANQTSHVETGEGSGGCGATGTQLDEQVVKVVVKDDGHDGKKSVQNENADSAAVAKNDETHPSTKKTATTQISTNLSGTVDGEQADTHADSSDTIGVKNRRT